MAELLLLGAQIVDVAGVRRHLERHALDDARCRSASRPAIFCGLLVSSRTRCDAEVAQDLRADAVVAQVLLEAELEVGLDRVAALVLQRVGADLVREADAAPFLVQVDEHAAPAPRRSAAGRWSSWSPQSQRSEPKTSPVRHSRVQAHQHARRSPRTLAQHQRHVLVLIDAVVVDDGAERRPPSRIGSARLGDAPHQRVGAQPMCDRRRRRVTTRQRRCSRASASSSSRVGEVAVVAEHLAQHRLRPAGPASRDEIARRLGQRRRAPARRRARPGSA